MRLFRVICSTLSSDTADWATGHSLGKSCPYAAPADWTNINRSKNGTGEPNLNAERHLRKYENPSMNKGNFLEKKKIFFFINLKSELFGIIL